MSTLPPDQIEQIAYVPACTPEQVSKMRRLIDQRLAELNAADKRAAEYRDVRDFEERWA